MLDRKDAATAVIKMAQAADALPGNFKAEIALRYHAGVSGPEPWQCEVEGDLLGDEHTFCEWGSSPLEAVERAVAEAWRRVPIPPEDLN